MHQRLGSGPEYPGAGPTARGRQAPRPSWRRRSRLRHWSIVWHIATTELRELQEQPTTLLKAESRSSPANSTRRT